MLPCCCYLAFLSCSSGVIACFISKETRKYIAASIYKIIGHVMVIPHNTFVITAGAFGSPFLFCRVYLQVTSTCCVRSSFISVQLLRKRWLSYFCTTMCAINQKIIVNIFKHIVCSKSMIPVSCLVLILHEARRVDLSVDCLLDSSAVSCGRWLFPLS